VSEFNAGLEQLGYLFKAHNVQSMVGCMSLCLRFIGMTPQYSMEEVERYVQSRLASVLLLPQQEDTSFGKLLLNYVYHTSIVVPATVPFFSTQVELVEATIREKFPNLKDFDPKNPKS